MANSLSSRRTMASQSCSFSWRASSLYKIAQILHVAAVHLSSMLFSKARVILACPLAFQSCTLLSHLIYKLQLFTTGLHGSCWSILMDVHMVLPNAFMHIHYGNSVVTCWRNFANLSTCELCLWSPLQVKCKSWTSSFHCLCLHASERDIPVKAEKGKKPLLLVQWC